jgi:hypothetical protein
MKASASMFITAVLVAAAWIVTGCGGSDEETLTKAEVIKQGDAICKQVDKRQLVGIKKVSKQFQQTTVGRKGQEMMVRAVMFPSIKEEAEELGDLRASSSKDQEGLEELVQSIEKDLSRVEDDLTLLEEAAGSPFAASEKLAKSYGFKACVEVL